MDPTITTLLMTSMPTLAVLLGVLIGNSRINDVRGEIAELRAEMRLSIANLTSHFDARLDDMKDTWRAELHRVEEVLDARLKHLEEDR